MIARPTMPFLAMSLLSALLCPAVCIADTVADFYKGRAITLVVGAAPGAIYDLTARTIAQHLTRFIPGEPGIVTQNMPGASQIRATEYSYNVAPRDGSSLLVVQSSIVLNKILEPQARYDTQRFTWIGRTQKLEVGGFVWHKSSVKSLDDAKTREVVLGGNSATGYTAIIPWALNRLTGTKFRVVRGYESQRAVFLAVERGEVEGVGSSALGDIAEWLKSGQARLLFVSQLQRKPSYPYAPTISELVKSESDRDILRLIAATSDMGVTLIAPPDIPEDRRNALRLALDKMVVDPAFVHDLQKAGFDVDPMSGADIARFVTERVNPSAELLERFRAATAPM